MTVQTLSPEGMFQPVPYDHVSIATGSRHVHVAGQIARSTVAGAKASGWAEYWNPHTGEGLGAVPQSWTALAATMTPEEPA